MSGIQSKADVRDGIRRRTRNTKDIKGLVFFNEVLKKIEESRRLGAAGRCGGGAGEGCALAVADVLSFSLCTPDCALRKTRDTYLVYCVVTN